MSQAVTTSSLDDTRPESRVKGVKFDVGRKYRIGFPLLTEAGKIRIDGVKHYKFNTALKKRFCVPEDAELAKACEKVMGDPQIRYVTVICVYETNKEGRVAAVKEGKLVGELEYELVPIVLNDEKLNALKNKHAEFPLTDHDMVIECSDKDFQKLDFTPAKSAFWKQDAVMKDVLERANSMAKKMVEAVATKATDATIKSWIGGSSNDEEDGTESKAKDISEENIEGLLD